MTYLSLKKGTRVKSLPILDGNKVSSSSWSWTHDMRKSIYLGAEHLIGFFTVIPSAQWYSYLGPADITGQVSSVQNSVIVPYNMLIWLKKSTAVIEMIIAVCT